MAAKLPGRIVTLVRRGTRPAFVVLPGAGGGFGPYLRLAAQIGQTHNVHLVRASGLMPGEEPERSVDAMAASALEALDAAGIAPQVVFGWSMGGVIGWELCVRLAERGELPDLVLVDSSPLPHRSTVGGDARLRARIIGMLGPRPHPAILDRVRRTVDAQLSALAGYRTQHPYAGRVLLLTCSDSEIEARVQSSSRWRSLARGLSAGQLAANHFNVFDERHLPELCERITTFLGAATAAGACAGHGNRGVWSDGLSDRWTGAIGDGVRFAVDRIAALADVATAESDLVASRGLPAPRMSEFRAARALLRALLADEVGPDAAAGRIAARESGQPYLPERTDLAISLSHTHEHVAAAIGVGIAVGIDVQAPVPVSAGVIRRCCMPRVRDELAALSQAARELEFAWIWTVQEACVKAIGAGLAGEPWTIPVRRAQRDGEWHGHNWLSFRDESAVPVSVAYARPGRLL